MKKTIAFLLAVFLTLSCSACGTQRKTEQTASHVFTDSLGREVTVPEEIKNVVVTGPLAQMMVFAAAPDTLTALAAPFDGNADEYLDEKYLSLPVFGQLFGGKSEMNVEELMNAKPDVIIDVGETKSDLAAQLDDLTAQTGLPVVHLTAGTLDYSEAFTMLGELLNCKETTDALNAYCENADTRTQKIMDSVGENKKTALYCLGDLGCNVLCKGSYHASVLDMLTENVAVVENPSAKGTGNEVNLEQLYNWNPEVLFFAPQSIYATVGSDELWQGMQAVQNGAYYEVPFGVYNWAGFPPSVQLYLCMSWMAKVLYPEYADYELYEEACEFYRLFLHCDLTREQYGALTANSLG